jgi:L-alanine-DL-glutamate epimerase-like enolase superfamily enzyme
MATRIDRIEVFPLRYPVVGRFKFFEGPKGQPAGRAAVLVKITAADGTVGWGQSVPVPRWSYETLESVATTLERYLAPELIGLDAFDAKAIQKVLDGTIAPSFSTGQPIAKAGIDLALFDLTGKILGQSAAQRWNLDGKPGVLLSWTLNPRTLDEIDPLIEQGRARGYKHFNVKVAPDPAFDLALCKQVKARVPDGFLWADANGGYDEATALAVAPKLADAGVAVLEQPLPPNRLRGFARLRRQKALPILMDEGIVSSVELEEFFALGLLDGVAMKPARCGGLAEARRQVEFCNQHGLMVLGSGLTDPDVSLAASLALYAAYGIATPCALNGPQFLGASLLKEPLNPIGGTIAVPTGPGLGVTVDEARIPELLVKGG